MATSIDPASARRIALAAQGFGTRHPATVGPRRMAATIARLGLLQLDSVNVFERSHHLPVFARLGGFDRTALDRVLFDPRGGHIEYWAHQAAVIPVATWPLLRWRMHEFRTGRERAWAEGHPQLSAWLLAELAANGPMAASEIEHDANQRRGPWWGWSDVKIALEHLFRRGEVVTAGRRRFERVYALPEQVLPGDILDRDVDDADAKAALIAHAAQSLGIADESDLADYWRMRRADTRAALHRLSDEGVVMPVTVPGWVRTGWLHRDARRPRRLEAAALLSPFDPVVWFRERGERLFDFRYRIEIYTPAHKRVFGYYSLPVLLDDRIVGRIDLKSDRAARVLRVQSAWREPGVADDVAERIVPLLDRAREWQGLDAVEFTGRGDLSEALAAEWRARN